MHVRDIVSIEGSVENVWKDLSIISCGGFESMYSGLEKLEEKREKKDLVWFQWKLMNKLQFHCIQIYIVDRYNVVVEFQQMGVFYDNDHDRLDQEVLLLIQV